MSGHIRHETYGHSWRGRTGWERPDVEEDVNEVGPRPACTPTQIAWHATMTLTSTSHPPQQQDTVHRELHPGTGKGALACAGPLHSVTRPAAGRAPAAAHPASAAPHDTSPTNNNRPEEMRTSCHQQPAPPPIDVAKMSPRISIGPEPVLASHAQSPPAAGSHGPTREGSAPYQGTEFFQTGEGWVWFP